ncbi:MAG: DUF5034 domain-containing protein [Chitinophagales bacterium]
MIKFLRIFLILTFLQIGTLVLTTSCCEDEYIYFWSELYLSNVDNRGERPITAEENRLPAIAYAIGMSMAYDFVHQTSPLNGFSNSAYAYSCAESYQRNDTIEAVRIRALSDFDEFHPAGTDLTDFFAAKTRGTVTAFSSTEEKTEHAIAVSSFVENVNESEPYYILTDFDLFLLESPSQETAFQFIVEVELSNEKILVDTTESIILY